MFAKAFDDNGVDRRSYLSHDRAVIARHPNQGAKMSAEHLPLDQCAAVCLPFIPTSFYKSVEGAVQTGHYRGWQNLNYLRSVKSGFRDDVRELQANHGLQLTDFTQL